MHRSAAVIHCVLLLAIVCVPSARALEPDEIVLIVNQNVPAGRTLAEFYANARLVPREHILELDLPRGEDILPLQFERDVVPRVREFLKNAKLDERVKCLVTRSEERRVGKGGGGQG